MQELVNILNGVLSKQKDFVTISKKGPQANSPAPN